MQRPFPGYAELDALKHDCIEASYLPDLEYFHCANDSKPVRALVLVFNRLESALADLRIDTLVVEKAKTDPALQPAAIFYPHMIGRLLKHVTEQEQRASSGEMIVVTDTLPVQRQRKAVTKAIRQALHRNLPPLMSYRIVHHASKAHYRLQMADYFCWAVYRKWERGDAQHSARLDRRSRVNSTSFAAAPLTTTRLRWVNEMTSPTTPQAERAPWALSSGRNLYRHSSNSCAIRQLPGELRANPTG